MSRKVTIIGAGNVGATIAYTLSLGDLASEIVVIDILEPYSVEEMTSGEFDLTLFTCTQGGSHRVTVRCDSKNK